MKVNRFEDLVIWQMARELCKYVFDITSNDIFKNDYKLKNQIRGSSGSVMDNIAEGFDRGGKKEFIQFLYISKGSCSETRSQSYRCFDSNYINSKQHDELLRKTDTISKKIYSLIKYLKSSDMKGEKYT
jgi:four helix bundle protein